VKDASEYLERVENLAEAEVKSKGYNHGRNHDQAGVPAFRYIIFIVEDGEGGEYICEDRRRSATGEAPGGRGNPSCVWWSIYMKTKLEGEQANGDLGAWQIYKETSLDIPCNSPQNLGAAGAKLADHRYCAPTVGSLYTCQIKL
jgi:hypothetical protein